VLCLASFDGVVAMRSFAVKSVLAGVAGCWLAVPAAAGTKVVSRVETYTVTGTTGRALVQAMDRSGPRHGFMARAIAQTSYKVDWQLDVKPDGNGCRVLGATGTLNVTYIFPRAASPLAPALAGRWKRFLAGVRKHEQNHGRIARDMVAAAGKAVRGVAVPEDRSCWKTRAEAKRRIAAVSALYEKRQVAFDMREHRDGGPVERLVAALVRER